MTKIHILYIFMTILTLAGCKRDPEDTQHKTSDNTLSSILSQKPIDPESNNIALSNALPKGWIEIKPIKDDPITRCMNINGCEWQGKKYLPGSELRNILVFCGTKPAYEFVENYYCEPTYEAMRCMNTNCSCGDTTGYKRPNEGDFCIDNKKFVVDNAYLKTLFAYDNFSDDEDDELDNNDEESDDSINPITSDEDINSCRAKQQTLHQSYGSSFKCVDFIEKKSTTQETQENYYALTVCNNKSGCKTPDGRIFNYKMHDYFLNFTTNSDELFNNNSERLCTYHLEGDRDTTTETRCKTGDCVWPKDYDFDLSVSRQIIFLDQDEDIKDLPHNYHDPILVDHHYASNVKAYEVSVALPDTSSCDGGKRFCHGTSNTPIPAPNADGYVCQSLAYDNNSVKEWICTLPEGCTCGETTCEEGASCTNGVCACHGIILEQNSPYTCHKNAIQTDAVSFAICKDGNCPCGESRCEAGAICQNNKCYCGNTKPELEQKGNTSNGWICKTHDNIEFTEICGNEDGCTLSESIKCPLNTTIKNNDCYCGKDKQPTQEFICTYDETDKTYYWVCQNEMGCGTLYGASYKEGDMFRLPDCWSENALSEEGCMCGDERHLQSALCLESLKYGLVNVCNNTSGCHDQNRHCNYGEYMKGNTCIVPDSMDGKAAENYWIEAAYQNAKKAVKCEQNECPCGNTICKWGESCQDNQCTYATIHIHRFGKRFNYEFADDFDIRLDKEPAEAKRIIRRMLYGDWAGCYSGLEDRAFTKKYSDAWHLTNGDGDDISTYTCSFSHDCELNPSSYGEKYGYAGNVVPFGLMCLPKNNDPETCQCGQRICPKSNNCFCTTKEGKLDCGCINLDSYDASWPSERVCSGTVVETNDRWNYVCKSGLGFVCYNPNGCPCGKTTCAPNTVCVKPDMCTVDEVYRL